MKKLKINSSVESFLVMILMIIFAVSVSFIIIEGQAAFERVTENKLQDEQARIALAYINKRIKQNDVVGGIAILNDGVEGIAALEISEVTYGDDWKTYIFFKDGIMYECYTDVSPTLDLSAEIVPLDGLSFEIIAGNVETTITYEYQGKPIEITQVTTLRSGGSYE